ncbi:MAG: hypothetical protein ACJ763_17655 [Bdellovibrionia bacterium]
MARIKNSWVAAAVLGVSLATSGVAQAQERASVGYLATYIKNKDYLAARIMVSRLQAQLKSPSELQRVYWILLSHPDIGEDMISSWQRTMDQAAAAQKKSSSPMASMEKYLNWADSLMYAGQSAAAVDGYQKAAQWLRTRRDQEKAKANPSQLVISGLDQIYPYVLHSLARALYADRRYREALEVYSWMKPGYARFHRVLFEKMWTAYYAQRADLALGAISSQHSAYFSDYVDPETYLVQLYLFKRLCRQSETDKILAEVKAFKKKITDGIFTYEDFAKSEVFTQRILRVSEQSADKGDAVVSAAERRAERDRIKTNLSNSFNFSKKSLLENLSLVEAYSTMATTPGMELGFEPMRKTTDRDELIRRNLEVWPIEANGEEWADEVGSHFYLGESQCKKEK